MLSRRNILLFFVVSGGLLVLAGSAEAALLLGDPTLNYTGSHDGWSSNMVVQQGQNPSAGFWCSYTNISAANEVVTPLLWSYAVAEFGLPWDGETRVTPFVVKVLNADLNAADSMQTLAIGTTRVYGWALDFYDPGIYTQEFGGSSFVLAPGETMAIGFIDADPDGTNNLFAVLREGDPNGENMGNANIWYNGGPDFNQYNGRAPDPLGKIFGGGESFNINRNYQYNMEFDIAAETLVPEPSTFLLSTLGLFGLLLWNRRKILICQGKR